MTDFVILDWKRNRGWPWPEESYGLTPMFGEDGWCDACGVPRHEQTGSLILERKGMSRATGAWVPYWRGDDALCLEGKLASRLGDRFDLDLREIQWHPFSAGEAMQIVIPSVGERWFDPEELRAAATDRHGTDGARCDECGVWRWMPLAIGAGAPPLRITPPDSGDGVDIMASPEWFGDEWRAFRQILVRRELAEEIAAASPRDFRVEETS